MALFEVEGWDIKSDKIAIGGKQNKKAKKPKKEKKRKASQAVEQLDQEDQDEHQDKESKAKKPKHNKTEKIEEPKNSEEPKSEEPEKSEEPKKSEKPEISESKVENVPKPESDAAPATQRKLSPLQQKMMAKLSGSRFRWINEQLYTTTSEKALKLVKEQPALFDEYHEGFRSQVQLWPENPVDVFVDQFKARASKPVCAPGGLPGLPNKKVVIADMGCGEAQLALDVNNFVKEHNSKKPKPQGTDKRKFAPRKLDVKVHSFDLKKDNNRITVADIKNVPLADGSCTIVIFCLALMGTNFLDFIKEAQRLLAPNGELWIAEIKSRFSESANAKTKAKKEDVGTEFVDSLKLLGFFHKKTDNSNKMFTRFEFFKPSKDIMNQRKEKLERRMKFIEQETQKEEFEQKRAKLAEGKWLLKPCIYKRR